MAIIAEAHRFGLAVPMGIVHSHASNSINDGIYTIDSTS